MQILPKSLQALIDELGKLPGVGERTAERYALAILRKPNSSAKELARCLSNLHQNIKVCPKTFMLIEVNEEMSNLYTSPKRDKTTVVVVEDSFDVVALEKADSKSSWTYHVLGGALSPIDGIEPSNLHIQELLERVKQDNVKEVIIATNASVEGESTSLYLQKQLKDFDQLIISRIARGLPAGVDLEYADQLTLSRALSERQAI